MGDRTKGRGKIGKGELSEESKMEAVRRRRERFDSDSRGVCIRFDGRDRSRNNILFEIKFVEDRPLLNSLRVNHFWNEKDNKSSIHIS